VGAEILPSILAGLRVRHPGLAIELVLSNRVADLLRRDADIAVRMVRPAQEALIARRIGDLGIGLFAHRDYVARYGLPQSIDDLRNHALIGFDRDDLAFRSVSISGIPMTRDLFTLRTDSDLAQLAALRAGFGIGGVQIPLAARSGDLIRALPGQIDFTLEIWLAMHEDMRTSLPVRLVFDALAAGLAAYLG
jgi:DNA-binding transcriptional LysR family regulator